MNKKYIVLAVAFIAVGVGGYAAGRYTTEAKVVETVKTVEVEKEVVKTVVQVVEKKVYVRAQVNDVHQETVTIQKPDGTVETKVTVIDKTRTEEASTQEASSMAVQDVDRTRVVDTDRVKVVDNQAQWHLSLRAGAGVRFIGVLEPQFNVGVQAERRIIGPFFAGLFAETVFNMGPRPPYNVMGGLVLGLEL